MIAAIIVISSNAELASCNSNQYCYCSVFLPDKTVKPYNQATYSINHVRCGNLKTCFKSGSTVIFVMKKDKKAESFKALKKVHQ